MEYEYYDEIMDFMEDEVLEIAKEAYRFFKFIHSSPYDYEDKELCHACDNDPNCSCRN